MRIRSIKPEFWTSQDIADLTWDERLVFIGLWSYVDDNGVGRDVEKLVTADLFPLEEDPRDTLARVSGALAKLSEAGRITRYTVGGRTYLHVTNWGKHQRIDKPAKERYPLPTCGDAEIRDTLATPSRQSPETPAPGTGEQRNRGTGEQGTTPPPPVGSAQTLLGEWIDHCTQPPPGRVKGQVASELKKMLDEGIDYERVRQGLASWQQRGLHPSTLASVVHELATPRLNGRAADVTGRTERTLARIADRENQLKEINS